MEVSAPTEVHAAASASGSVGFGVRPGFTGTLNSTLHGLVAVTPVTDSVSTGAFDVFNPAADAHTKHYQMTVAAAT